jgi:hypothetical protein
MVRTGLVRYCLVLLAALTWGSPAAGDDTTLSDPVVAKLNDKVLQFLEGISQGNESGAFKDLLVGSQLAEQTGAVKALIDKSKEIVERYGAYRESEAISAKRLGRDVVLLRYLYKCEKFPVVWHIAFYRDFSRTAASDDSWVVISLRFDTQLDFASYN